MDDAKTQYTDTREEFIVLQEELGLSDTQLAAYLGVTTQTVYKWKRGDIRDIRKPYMDMVRRLAEERRREDSE